MPFSEDPNLGSARLLLRGLLQCRHMDGLHAALRPRLHTWLCMRESCPEFMTARCVDFIMLLWTVSTAVYIVAA